GNWLEHARELVRSWMTACPPPHGDAWEAYPVARRILNWCLAGYIAPVLGAELAAGIAGQVRFLSKHLEYHLLGNHLLCDAAARAMSRWLASIAREDGVPYVNDSAPDASPPVSDVLSLARALHLIDGPWDSWLGRVFGLVAPPAPAPPRTDVELPDTGWSMVREGQHELLFEHGPIGPDEQPGHGHSDALSSELFWDGHPVVIDTGDTTYDVGSIRAFERSAAAHACVTVGGEGPDELWAAFRVGARGKVSGGRQRHDDARVRVFAGAVRAPAGWTHFRRIIFWPGEALVVLDRVVGARADVC